MLSRPIRAALFLVLGLTALHVLFFSAVFFVTPLGTDFLLQRFIWFLVLAFLDSGVVALLFIYSSAVFSDYLATYRRLLRLENLSHPLLVRLSMEAPGTYHHSLLLANLAYNATKAIRGDAMLARVGAYYHDVGKIKNPEYFTENQTGDENPHDALDPRQSAEIIKRHVKDGRALAAEYHVPNDILAFITEHQGTTQIGFFAEKAKQWLKAGKLEWVREGDFRYDGPKPQSKETAILMLADTIEAKMNGLGEPTEEAIAETVNSTIAERIADGELKESRLTETDLTRISRSFVASLMTMYHRRVHYPKKGLRQLKQALPIRRHPPTKEIDAG